jgi:hypothetical protein
LDEAGKEVEGGGEGEWYGHPGRQCPRGGKINILNKNIDYFALNKFLNIETNKGKYNKYSLFLHFVIFVRSGYCNHSPRAPKSYLRYCK